MKYNEWIKICIGLNTTIVSCIVIYILFRWNKTYNNNHAHFDNNYINIAIAGAVIGIAILDIFTDILKTTTIEPIYIISIIICVAICMYILEHVIFQSPCHYHQCHHHHDDYKEKIKMFQQIIIKNDDDNDNIYCFKNTKNENISVHNLNAYNKINRKWWILFVSYFSMWVHSFMDGMMMIGVQTTSQHIILFTVLIFFCSIMDTIVVFILISRANLEHYVLLCLLIGFSISFFVGTCFGQFFLTYILKTNLYSILQCCMIGFLLHLSYSEFLSHVKNTNNRLSLFYRCCLMLFCIFFVPYIMNIFM